VNWDDLRSSGAATCARAYECLQKLTSSASARRLEFLENTNPATARAYNTTRVRRDQVARLIAWLEKSEQVAA
jgi:hypothetical protein